MSEYEKFLERCSGRDLSKWNVCVDTNTFEGIPVVGIYIMGSGCGQCEDVVYFKVDGRPEPMEYAASLAMKDLGVSRVTFGVG